MKKAVGSLEQFSLPLWKCGLERERVYTDLTGHRHRLDASLYVSF